MKKLKIAMIMAGKKQKEWEEVALKFLENVHILQERYVSPLV